MKRIISTIVCVLLCSILSVNAITYTKELEAKANGGDANSQYLMCHCYIDGLGVESDYEVAFEWCEKAASQGHMNALTQMGYFYFSGKGVNQEIKRLLNILERLQKKVVLKLNLCWLVVLRRVEGLIKMIKRHFNIVKNQLSKILYWHNGFWESVIIEEKV